MPSGSGSRAGAGAGWVRPAAFWLACLGVFSLAAGAGAAEAGADAAAKPLILLAVTGDVQGGAETVTAADREAARQHVEAALGRLLAEQFPVRLMDDVSMKKVRADAERWAVLAGGSVGDVRKVLDQYQPDWLVRATLHTSALRQVRYDGGAAGVSTFWACTGGILVELIPRQAGVPPLGAASPPQAEPKKRLKALETALVALDDAAAGLMQDLKAKNAFGAGTPARPAAAAEQLAGRKVILVTAGDFDNGALDAAAKQLAVRQFETDFGNRLAAAFGLRAFEEEALAKARKNAEQWAVLQGGTVDQVREALKPYALDYCLRVRFHGPAPFVLKGPGGETSYSGTATVTLEIINLAADRGTKARVVESPPMGTNEDPAVRAADPFDAVRAALAHCAGRILERLAGAPAAGDGAAAAAGVAGRPTVAVLWVKPDFEGWTVPRGSQPTATRRHQQRVNEFVKQAKSSGSAGMQVSQYLVQGLAAGGVLVPVEDAGRMRQDLAGLKNKLLELRMAGWVGEKLPYSDPVEAGKAAGGDYVATARITRIEEPQPTSVAVPLFGAAKAEVRAWAEVTVTEAKTGRSLTFAGEGSMSKAGWSTGLVYTPEMKMDDTLFGGAIRAALLDAAGKVRF